MPPLQTASPQQQSHVRSISPQNSATPLLPAREKKDTESHDTAASYLDQGKRLFGLGKKNPQKDITDMASETAGPLLPQTQANVGTARPITPSDQKASTPALPIAASHLRQPYPQSLAAAASPSRLRSSSPRLHSPASSEIFERNVQEPVPIATLENEMSPAAVPGAAAHIASHVMTEDHIPAALQASVEAITSRSLNPDDVEIVTSTAHLPAAVHVLESSTSHADLTSLNSSTLLQSFDGSEPASFSQASGFLPNLADEDGASNYGALDPNDVRRLSFISFADVVQSEHNHPAPQSQLHEIGSRDSLHISSPRAPPQPQDRAASPFRSPRSPGSPGSRSLSGGITTPPPGISSSFRSDHSPLRSAGLAGLTTTGTQHGELNIETMRQVVHHTASGGLGAVRSAGMSPMSATAEGFGETRSRTNS